MDVGTGFGIGAFILAFLKIFQQDRVWRSLIKALRTDLTAARDELKTCASERASLRKEIEGYRSEIIALREQAQLEGWGAVKK